MQLETIKWFFMEGEVIITFVFHFLGLMQATYAYLGYTTEFCPISTFFCAILCT